MRTAPLTCGLVLVASFSGAQTTILTPSNTIGMTASADHNTLFAGQPILTSYQLEFYTTAAATCPATPTGTPLVVSMGKPTPDGTNTVKSLPVVPMIAPNTVYCAYGSALGPGGTSARTNGVGPFGVPGKPGAPTAATLVP
jgi:ABC-type spermidine/putrescine transport system permease subunit II